jgi:outer membrane protein OmpA-like peptidoglycan-associated protein
MKKSFISICIVTFLITTATFAQFSKFKTIPHSNTVVFTLAGGISHSETDYTNAEQGLYGAGIAEYFFTTSSKVFLGLKFEAGLSQIKGNIDDNHKFEENAISFGPTLTANFQLNKKLYPYVGLGVKNLWYNDYTAIAFAPEFGIHFLISNYFAINGHITFNFASEDDLDDKPILNSKNDFFANIGLSISYAVDFTVSDDIDDDGIKNNIDGCPEQAEDKDGFEDNDGCPEFDNDQDGIVDTKDECKNEAEDFDGFEDNDGCPDPDNDGDGIQDINDECPDLMEDFDGFEDNDGCPELDNDKDGILDVNDKCPNKPETFNNFEDGDGCPDTLPETEIIEEPEIKPEINESVIKNSTQKNVQPQKIRLSIPNQFYLDGQSTFNSNTINLSEDIKSELDHIAQQMLGNPDFKWKIEGHMDNSGSPSELKKISEDRAKSIKKYLVTKGVADSSIQTIGLGDKAPLAPNSTIQGRLKNRRVVIKRIR